ncbi:MAG TPA: TonB-dependent receptor [Rhizomicrobium sp.]|jgi:outer membrane receptor protein involved in Fe transport
MATLAGAALFLSAPDANAQSASPQIEEVIVTGTRIPQTDATSISPLIGIDSATIKTTGATRIEDFLNQLPQIYADQNSTTNNPQSVNAISGTATVNLRDLGPERTLVLLDGKRLMPGDPTNGSIAPDLNFIPDALVNRVEIVTGGQSAVYGSDAVAGAVNFILKRDFTGFQLDLQGGGYQHDNDETGIQARLLASGTPRPPRSVFDGFDGEITLTAGTDTDDGKGNLSLYGGYRAGESIGQGARDFSACPLEAKKRLLVCSGSTFSTANGQFFVIDPTGSSLVSDLTLDPSGAGNTLRDFDPRRDAFNYAPFEYAERPDQRFVAGTFAHYELAPAIELYADGMYMSDVTNTRLAPSGLFGNVPVSIACANPLLSADEVQRFCTDAGVPLNGDALLAIGRRDVGAGGREERIAHSDYRILAGAKGVIDDWRYDVSAQFGSVALGQTDVHDVSLSRAFDALDAVRNASGAIVCASGNPGCVPYDVFSLNGITPAALAYVDARAKARGDTGETVASANIAGDLSRYGVISPWAQTAAGVALGAEYRRESLGYAPDAEIASGDLASAGFSSPAVSGAFGVEEVYAELRLPLVQGKRMLLEDLTASAGYRYSDYSNAGGAQTYKLGLEWVADDAIRFRSGFNRAERAPNVVELFTPQTLTPAGLDHDPCAGTDPIKDDPFATQINCARTGVTASQYGNIAPSPETYNALVGGSPALKPETANTFTIGAVATPLEGLSLSLDYFDIDIHGVITTLDPDLAIEQCLQTGNPYLCGLIHRAPISGSLWLSTKGYVSDLSANVSQLETRGIDADATYVALLPHWNGGNWGAATFRLMGTYTNAYTTTPEPGATPYDCAGLYGFLCGDPIPRWRHVLRTTWNTPDDFDVTVAWRFTGAERIATASSNPNLTQPFGAADYRLGDRSYIDLSVNWRASENWELRAGVNNIFDRDPPIFGFDYASGVASDDNTYPGVYDALGRWVFVGITVRQ